MKRVEKPSSGDRVQDSLNKLVSWDEAEATRRVFAEAEEEVVFTNGCFDLLHSGHVTYLQRARDLGDVLIVGLNSDDSITRLKGDERPILQLPDRVCILAALEAVDYICVFEEDTPTSLIERLRPDILVKGGDYKEEDIVGRKVVEAYGGRVATVPYVEGQSTTRIIQRLASGNDKT